MLSERIRKETEIGLRTPNTIFIENFAKVPLSPDHNPHLLAQ